MIVSDIETAIRRNIVDLSDDPKYDIYEIISNIQYILNTIWEVRRIAFCENEVLVVKPDFPQVKTDEIPISDHWVDVLIDGVSARMLRYNSSDPATKRAADNFQNLFEQMLA